MLRGGYGIFYDKTLGYAVNNYRQATPYISSFTASFPQDTADPGPSNGMAPGGDLFRLIEVTPGSCPANPNGSACPNVNRQVLNELFPAGSRQLNSGSIEYDNPYREQPYSHQLTIGYERELTPVLSASVDYVRQLDRDTHMRQNLNPRLRTGTGRTDPITRSDAFGVLAGTLDGDDWYAGDVRFTTSNGSGTYNALNFQLEKRYADNWGFRAVYALAKKETNSLWFTYTNFCQVGAMLNVDCLWGPSQYDRRHNFTLSGRTEIPCSAASPSAACCAT